MSGYFTYSIVPNQTETLSDPYQSIVADNREDQCPKISITLAEKPVIIKELFDPNEPPEGEQFYSVLGEAGSWSSTTFDVDEDSSPEKILTADIAMNHTPHILRIIKDGYVIFKAKGANIGAEEVADHNGFILKETMDWINDIRKQTRYIHENGRFIPVWYQQGCKEL